MHITWDAVQLFLAAAELGTLSRAAEALRLTQPTVSRRLADLERTVGEPLFVRSVSGVRLTAAGERLLAPAKRMAEGFGEVERAASGVETGPRGVVRITAPPGVAYELLAPFAAKLRVALPDVRLDVIASVHALDLVRREADLALRAQASPSRELVTLASVSEPVKAYATAAYAATLPQRPSLGDVAWIAWSPSMAEIAPNPQLAARIPDFVPAFASDDFLVQLRAAEAGVGAVILGAHTSRLALPSALVPLAIDLGKMTASLHLLAVRSSLGIARVRAVADLLVKELTPGARRRRGGASAVRS